MRDNALCALAATGYPGTILFLASVTIFFSGKM